MKCVAMIKCQKRLDNGPLKGKVKFFRVDEVWDFEVCPKNFRPIGTTVVRQANPILPGEPKVSIVEGVNFETASQEELEESDFKLAELKEYMTTNHPQVTFPGNISRDKLLAKLLYARTNDTTTTGEVKNAIGANDVDSIEIV